MHVVLAGAMPDLAATYRAQGATVTELALAAVEMAAAIEQPVDLLVISDIDALPGVKVTDLDRAGLAAAMRRLTWTPFRLATLLRPQLAAAGGTMVLLTRPEASLTRIDSTGDYRDRPFRVAAQQLWRSLSVEWRDDGIGCRILAVAPETAPTTLVAAISAGADTSPAVKTDAAGAVLEW